MYLLYSIEANTIYPKKQFIFLEKERGCPTMYVWWVKYMKERRIP